MVDRHAAELCDPPVPPGGECVVCGDERQVPKGTWARGPAAADPFCSSECCRQWYGVELLPYTAYRDLRQDG